MIFIIISVILCYIIIKYFFIDNVAPFVSNMDGKNYTVRSVGTVQNRQTAANYLAQISKKINEIVNYMYINKLPDLDTANRLYNRWSNCKLKETNSSETSAAYTLNKSAEIRLCIRDKNGNFEDINTSMFVVLHELAHVMSVSYGHGEEFKNNFSYITHLASSIGIYKPELFQLSPKTYCGVNITSTPCSTDGSCSFNAMKKKNEH